MKIAFVVHDYHSEGGHSRYVAELAKRFAPAHDVHVYANSFKPAQVPGLTFHRIPAWRNSSVTTILTFPAPTFWLDQRAYDVVHSQGFSAMRCNVITAHVCGKAWHQARARIEKLNWKDQLFRFIVNPLEERYYRSRRPSKIIAISDQVRQDLRSLYGCPQDISVIRHGVDLTQFSLEQRARHRNIMRAELGLGEDDFAALYVGDLRKGAACAMKAIARNAGMRMVFVSRTPAAAYRALAEDLGVGARTTFVPATPEIERYYAAADCFLFPSSYDAFGMVVSEAMAMGLPVISSRAAGASECITDGVDGLLVADAADDEAFGCALAKLREDEAFRQKVAKAGWRAATQQGWDHVAQATLKVYESVIAGESR